MTKGLQKAFDGMIAPSSALAAMSHWISIIRQETTWSNWWSGGAAIRNCKPCPFQSTQNQLNKRRTMLAPGIASPLVVFASDAGIDMAYQRGDTRASR